MYTILYGDSGLGKGTSTKVAAQLFVHHLKGRAMDLKVIPGNITNEWLIETMHKRNEEGRDAAFLLITEEIGTMCGMEQYKAGLVDTLTLWYDCPDFGVGRSTLKGREQEVTALYPNVLTNGTPKTFKALRQDVIAGGFLPRHYTVYVRFRRTGLPWEWSIEWKQLKGMVETMTEQYDVLDSLCASKETAMVNMIVPKKSRSYALLNKVSLWLDDVIDTNPIEEERAWYNRFVEKTLTLAMVMQFIEGRDVRVLDEECLAQAVSIMQWITPGVFDAYNQISATLYSSQQQMIAKMIQNARQGGVWLHVLMATAVQRMHVKPDNAEQIMRALKAAGRVASESRAMKDGRKGWWVTWVA